MNTNSSSFLSEIILEEVKVIDASISKSQYTPIDLSKSNLDLNKIDINSHLSWEKYIKDYINNKNAKVAYGGYLEERSLYDRSAFFNNGSSDLKRNIHLGLDLWVEAGTQVLSAFPGEVHSFKDNVNFGDYGPTIILKHNLYGIEFHTLYGHLSKDSITKIKEGDKVAQGETIGRIGIAEVNGEYAPHLHFQVIKDMQGQKGDYAGVSNIKDLDFYKKNCPDPSIILNLNSNRINTKAQLEELLSF